MKNVFYIIVIFVLFSYTGFAQRIAVHTITNFDVDTTSNTFSFDIYSQSIGAQSIRVGLTSYYFNFDSSALSTPVLSDVNPKYTIGSPTGDYNEMTAEIILGEIAVTILFNGNGVGTGDTLSTIGPLGELICTVTLRIDNPNNTIYLRWDSTNSAMNTPSFQTITNFYQGSYNNPTIVEFNSFTGKIINGAKVELKWTANTGRSNYGFEIERLATDCENPSWLKIAFIKGSNDGEFKESYTYVDDNIWGGRKFKYRLKQIDNNGTFEYSDIVEIEVVPTQYELSQNYPNPFNPSTTIRFSLPKETQLKIKIYNMLGELVETIAEGKYEVGNYKVTFNASSLPSGVYIYRLESSDPSTGSGQSFMQAKKMLLLK